MTGLMTLEQFRQELIFVLRNRTDTGTGGVSDDRLDRWVNFTYTHICHPSVFKHRAMQLRFTLTLVSGTNEYSFNPSPAGLSVLGVRSVSHIQALVDTPTAFRTKLLPRDVRWFEQRSITTGPPKIVAREGNLLVVDPVPGTNQAGQLLKVLAWREPAPLAAGQATVLEPLWDEVILLGARWRAERDLGYRELAELTKQDFAALLNEFQDFQVLDAEDWGWAVDVPGESHMEAAP